jgi:hypothetical protein
MQPTKESFLPPKLIILDAIGTVLLGLGLAKQLADVDFLPSQYQFEGYSVVLVGVGLAFMLPIIIHLVRRIKKRNIDAQ